MNTTEFLNFRERLKSNLNHINSVTGLAFVGSAADTSRADEWSDHDFFVFTSDGHAEALRQDITWLPDYDDIANAIVHGLTTYLAEQKMIFEPAHVLT